MLLVNVRLVGAFEPAGHIKPDEQHNSKTRSSLHAPGMHILFKPFHDIMLLDNHFFFLYRVAHIHPFI